MGEESVNSKRYSSIKLCISLSAAVLTIISIIVFQCFLSDYFSHFASRVSRNFYGACFIYSSIFLIFLYIIGFPFHIISSFFVEHRFNLSKQSFAGWVSDEAKSVVLSSILSVGCILVFYFFLRNFTNLWWCISAFSWVFFTIILAKFMPVILIPIFFKYLPIKDEGLKSRIMDLAEKSGLHIVDVCQVDFSKKTKKANAALVGLGKTRKVILADTLVEDFSIEEISTVIAHELGHYKFRHIWRHLLFSGVTTTLAFFILSLLAKWIISATNASAIYDLSILPAITLLLIIFSFLLLPIQNLFSRIMEREADKFALDLTKDTKSFIGAMEKLAKSNLADMNPSTLKKIFFYSHPPINERIHMAEEYQGA